MPKPNGPRARWVQIEAAKHTTPESMQRRIAYAERQLRDLDALGSGRDIEMAREAHRQVVKVLSDYLAAHTRANRVAKFA